MYMLKDCIHNHMDELALLVNAKFSLQSIPKECRSDDFQNILDEITVYIEKHCKHQWVNDLIDVDPDRSKSICYCDYCFTTKNN